MSCCLFSFNIIAAKKRCCFQVCAAIEKRKGGATPKKFSNSPCNFPIALVGGAAHHGSSDSATFDFVQCPPLPFVCFQFCFRPSKYISACVCASGNDGGSVQTEGIEQRYPITRKFHALFAAVSYCHPILPPFRRPACSE